MMDPPPKKKQNTVRPVPGERRKRAHSGEHNIFSGEPTGADVRVRVRRRRSLSRTTRSVRRSPRGVLLSVRPAHRAARCWTEGGREGGSRRTGERERSRPISGILTGTDRSQWRLPTPHPHLSCLRPGARSVMLLCLTEIDFQSGAATACHT